MPREDSVDVVRIERTAFPIPENVVVLEVARGQREQYRTRDVDRPPRRTRLDRTLYNAVFHTPATAADVDDVLVKVDIGPAERNKLTAPHATANSELRIRRLKGSLTTTQPLERHPGFPLLDEVAVLGRWLKVRPDDGSDALFNSQKGGRMNRKTFLYAVAASS